MTRLQFTPPNPKELVITRRTRPLALSTSTRDRKAGSTSVTARHGQQIVLDRKPCDGDAETAGSAKRVTRPALGGAARRLLAEDVGDGPVFRRVVGARAGAVERDVVDGTGLQAGLAQSLAHRSDGARTFGMREDM